MHVKQKGEILMDIASSRDEIQDFKNRRYSELISFEEGRQKGFEEGKNAAVSSILKTMQDRYLMNGPAEAYSNLRNDLEIYMKSLSLLNKKQ